uniref:Phage tail protein C-terminal domain-containing protein n=1 Tax=Arsenophonus endosymbiont of Trialeurodes vaporariorum TaxID=235567 RepID=A0A3B0MF37_9GAMM
MGPGLCWGRGEYKCQLVGGYSNNKIKYRVRNGDNKTWSKWFDILTNTNNTFDLNGFLKRASPIIQIYPNRSFETNDESVGVNVQRTEVGKYFICGVMGYNADGAWGINDGVLVPKNSNGLELIYIKDKILSDCNIEIQTFHRQLSHLPEDFQNWRVKEINDGKPTYYNDGE